MKKLIFLLPLFTFICSFGQNEQEFKQHFNDRLTELRQFKGKSNNINVFSFNPYIKAIPNVVIKEIIKNKNDTLTVVRAFLNDLSYQIKLIIEDSVIRQNVSEIIVDYCADNDYSIRKRASDFLKGFNKCDFSKKSKKTLANYLNQKKDIYENIIRIIGFLDMKEQTDKLNKILEDSTIVSSTLKWNTRLALARLGDENQSYYCTNFVMMQQINNSVVHFLFADLIYTRSRIAFDFIIEQLNNDQAICNSANPDSNTPIVCGYRIMELLAPVIKDFPYKYYSTTNQLITKDYSQALIDIRLWFQSNPDYVILNDKY